MGATLATIIGALVAGAIIGPLARLALPGEQSMSLPETIGAGAVGALVGGFFAQLIGVGDTSGIDWIKLVIQVAVGAIAIVGWMNYRQRNSA